MVWLATLPSCWSLCPEPKFRKGDTTHTTSSLCVAAQPEGLASPLRLQVSGSAQGGSAVPGLCPREQGCRRWGEGWRALSPSRAALEAAATCAQKQQCEKAVCFLGGRIYKFCSSSWEASLSLVQWGFTGTGTMKPAIQQWASFNKPVFGCCLLALTAVLNEEIA